MTFVNNYEKGKVLLLNDTLNMNYLLPPQRKLVMDGNEYAGVFALLLVCCVQWLRGGVCVALCALRALHAHTCATNAATYLLCDGNFVWRTQLKLVQPTHQYA
jgi:hypothetical protein